MATIERRDESGIELFPLSLIAVSANLYDCIIGEIKKQYGEMIKKITEKMIKEKICSVAGLGEVVFISRKKLSVSVAIEDVSFPPTYKYGIIRASLLLPLYGKSAALKELIGRISDEIGLSKDATRTQNENGLNIKIFLSGETMPYQLIPNPQFAFNGRAQKCFVTRKDLSACSSIR